MRQVQCFLHARPDGNSIDGRFQMAKHHQKLNKVPLCHCAMCDERLMFFFRLASTCRLAEIKCVEEAASFLGQGHPSRYKKKPERNILAQITLSHHQTCCRRRVNSLLISAARVTTRLWNSLPNEHNHSHHVQN